MKVLLTCAEDDTSSLLSYIYLSFRLCCICEVWHARRRRTIARGPPKRCSLIFFSCLLPTYACVSGPKVRSQASALEYLLSARTNEDRVPCPTFGTVADRVPCPTSEERPPSSPYTGDTPPRHRRGHYWGAPRTGGGA